MTFWYFFKLAFLIIYSSLCAAIAYYIYKEEKKYYEPIYVLKKTGDKKDEEKMVYLHDEFDELARKDDPVSYPKLLFGLFTMVFVKLIIAMSFAYSLSLKLFKKFKKKQEKKEEYTKEEIQEIIESTKFHTSCFLHFSGIFFSKGVYQMKKFYQYIPKIFRARL